MAETKTASEQLFEKLNEAINGDVRIHQRINLHCLAVHGHGLIPYANNGASDADKAKFFAECLVAVKRKEWDKFKGQVATGQAEAPPEEPKVRGELEEEEEDDGEQARLDEESADQKEAPQPAVQPRFEPEADEDEDAEAALIENLKKLVGKRSKAPAVDEAAILKIVSREICEAGKALAEQVKAGIEELRKNAPPRDVIEIRSKTETVTLEGATHWQLPQVITWTNADVPLWLWGAAGGGKTTMARQVALALKLTPYVISIDPTMTVGKLLGFRNLATGEFVEGFLYRAYKDGGLVLLDEIDTGDPGILAALNALLANEYYTFPNGECVKRHADFRVMAGANTKGCGAVAGYTARNRLDAATLDRFAVIELEYDECLERAIALGEPIQPNTRWEGAKNTPEKVVAWVNWVQHVRSKVGNSVLVSPRASILGAKALRAGISPVEVAMALVFKLVTEDTKRNIISNAGAFQ